VYKITVSLSQNIKRGEGMRVSEYFGLNRSQPSLDFVDVDIYGDIEVFIDPRALRLLQSKWGDECVSLVQDFFRTVLDSIKAGDNEKAQRLLLALHEPNETHLGLSKDKSRGRALGEESSYSVYLVLSQSEAAKSGLLEDLEDTVLFVVYGKWIICCFLDADWYRYFWISKGYRDADFAPFWQDD